VAWHDDDADVVCLCLCVCVSLLCVVRDWPVDINHLEASAFCRWKSHKTGQAIRLPTEAEWTHMRNVAYPLYSTTLDQSVTGPSSGGQVNDQPYWARAPGNLNLEYYTSSSPVDMFPFPGSFPLFDVVGNVWQWTETPISPFPGFAPHPLYDDFSVPTFDGRHNLLMGGSFMSTGNEALRSARYAFRRHFMQHAGFRYIVSDTPLPPAEDGVVTEPDPVISVIIHEHFAHPQPLNLPNYSQSLAGIVLQAVCSAPAPPPPSPSPSSSQWRACEVGCGVGRTCFELVTSGRFEHVTGVDRTARLIRLASHLQHQPHVALPYCLTSEGELQAYHEVRLDSVGLTLTPEADSSLLFLQGDVNNLDDRHFKAINLLILNGVLEQMTEPALFLSSIHHRLPIAGVLVISTSFSWDEEVTVKDQWLGGRRENGESINSAQSMHDILVPHFCFDPTVEVWLANGTAKPVSQLPHFTPAHPHQHQHDHGGVDLPRPQYHDKRRTSVRTMNVTVWRRR
jgi:SAM-dependent methyltransferase